MIETDKISENLDRLAADFINDLIETPDAEILAELDDGRSIEIVLKTAQADLAAVKAQVGKARMAEAKAAVEQRRFDVPTSRRRAFSSQTARQRLIALATSHGLGDRLTLAARNGSAIPDTDLEGILDDLRDLGVNLEESWEE